MRTRRSPKNQEKLWRELGGAPEPRVRKLRLDAPEKRKEARSRPERPAFDPRQKVGIALQKILEADEVSGNQADTPLREVIEYAEALALLCSRRGVEIPTFLEEITTEISEVTDLVGAS